MYLDPHAKTLAAHGVVFAKRYLDPEVCDEIRNRIELLIADGDIRQVRGHQSPNALAPMEEPVIYERQGMEGRMLEIFNLDLLISEVADILHDKRINNIIDRAAKDEYKPDNINARVNRSVTNTRDFHVDTDTGKYKSFVYLTDVPDESKGPFSYIPNSHNASLLEQKVTRILNRLRREYPTNAIFHDEANAVSLTAPKGTLIVANLGGYHRWMPQEPGQELVLLTTSYTPK